MRSPLLIAASLAATAALAQEPEFGTILNLSYQGQDYGVQFLTVTDEIAVVGLPEADLRAFSPAVAQQIAAAALAHFNMTCSVGPATASLPGLNVAYEVAYQC